MLFKFVSLPGFSSSLLQYRGASQLTKAKNGQISRFNI